MVIESNFALSFLIIFLASFFLTFKVVPVLIRKMSARGLVGKDMNKLGEKKVAELGGIAIMLGFSFGVLIAIFISTYFNFLSLDFTLLFAKAGCQTILAETSAFRFCSSSQDLKSKFLCFL